MGRAAPVSSYFLCSEYGICATDALYLSVAISSKAILVSMDGEDFIDKLRKNHHNIETYHVSAFPPLNLVCLTRTCILRDLTYGKFVRVVGVDYLFSLSGEYSGLR